VQREAWAALADDFHTGQALAALSEALRLLSDASAPKKKKVSPWQGIMFRCEKARRDSKKGAVLLVAAFFVVLSVPPEIIFILCSAPYDAGCGWTRRPSPQFWSPSQSCCKSWGSQQKKSTVTRYAVTLQNQAALVSVQACST